MHRRSLLCLPVLPDHRGTSNANHRTHRDYDELPWHLPHTLGAHGDVSCTPLDQLLKLLEIVTKVNRGLVTPYRILCQAAPDDAVEIRWESGVHRNGGNRRVLQNR